MNSPSLTSEAMGRTLSGGGTGGGPAGVRTASAETMRRTASAGSRAPYRGGTSPGIGGGGGESRSGSRRPSMEDSQVRPTRPPVRPSLETISSFSPDKPIATTTAQQQQQARLQSPLPIRPARPTDTASRTNTFDSEDGEDDEGEYGGEDEGGFEPESPAATSDSDSSSSSSTPSEPVMSRIFRRPPGHAPQQQQQQQQPPRTALSGRERGNKNNNTAQAAEGDFGVIGLGISSGGSDEGDADADGDGEESETQAAFLRFKSNATKPQGSAAAGQRPRQHHHHHHHHHHQKRRSTADSSSPSSSASASPTTKAFKTPTVAAATAAAAGSSSSASAAAAARLQSSRIPPPGGDVRSPPRLQKIGSSAAARSPAVRAATRGGAGVPGISREGSEIGTTPSIGSSFSDLDDVSFTQSVLDEALGSKVEDTVVTPNPNSNAGDPMSSSATRRR